MTGRLADWQTGEVKDTIMGRLAVVSEIALPNITAFSCGLMMLC